jgi:hypothetical protein
MAGTGRIFVLEHENPALFDAYYKAYVKRFQPIDLVEAEQVQHMVSAIWRLRRIEAYETAIMDLEVDEQRANIDEIFDRIDDTAREAIAFRHLVDHSHTIDRITRYRTQARRAFTTALKTLQFLQGSRFNTTPLDPEDPGSFAPNLLHQPNTNETEPEPTPISGVEPLPSAPRVVAFQRRTVIDNGKPNEPRPLAAAA